MLERGLVVLIGLTTMPLLFAGCPSQVNVPNLVGMVRLDAEGALDDAGLSMGQLTSAYSDAASVGTVVSQNPPSGSSVNQDTAVDIVVSRGRVMLVNVDSPAVEISQDGLTWDTAYSRLQPAVEAAYSRSAEVWVARGTYAENRIGTDANGSLVLHPGVHMYGGFAAVENFRQERNWQANATVIDGSVARGGAVARTVVAAAHNVLLDGIAIQGGDAVAGGGVGVSTALLALVNCTIRDNSAVDGAGIYASGGSHLLLTNCSFIENAADNNGGAINCEGAEIAALGCTFNGNSAGLAGGAAFIEMDEADFDRCLFIDNTAGSSGGAIGASTDSSIEVSNCIFDGNSAISGGGIHMDTNGTGSIINSTFYGNSASASFGASLYMYDGVTVMHNCILEGHLGGDEVNLYPWASLTATNNYVGDGSVPGASTENPLFFDETGGDYRLQAGSPCIDTGNAGAASDHDFRGVARPQGAGPDIGAFEMVASDYD